jgi:hypothetical protein
MKDPINSANKSPKKTHERRVQIIDIAKRRDAERNFLSQAAAWLRVEPVEQFASAQHVAIFGRYLLRIAERRDAARDALRGESCSECDAAHDAVRDAMRRDARDALGRASGIVNASGADVDARLIDLTREGGAVADVLVADALACRSDLLAVGAGQRRGMLNWADSSVSRHVTRA